MSPPRVLVVSLPPTEGNLHTTAIRMEQRLNWLVRHGPVLGVEVEVVEAPRVLAAEPGGDLAEAFRRADGVWWCGRMASQEEVDVLWRALHAHLRAVGRGRTPVVDAPRAVWDADDLSRSFPRVRRAGVPQPRTRFYRLGEGEARLGERGLREVLAGRLGRVRVGEEGVFFRTYYGTRKLGGGMSIAYDRSTLVERVADLVEALRDGQGIGGIALREVLPIDQFWDEAERQALSREVRVFVVGGRPVFWSCHLDLEVLRRQVSERDLGRLVVGEEERARLFAWSCRVARRMRESTFTLDFAALEDGRWVSLETNPGYCSGWGHSAAYVAVFGAVLRDLVGLPRLAPGEVLARCAEVGVEAWGYERVFGLFEGLDPPRWTWGERLRRRGLRR